MISDVTLHAFLYEINKATAASPRVIRQLWIMALAMIVTAIKMQANIISLGKKAGLYGERTFFISSHTLYGPRTTIMYPSPSDFYTP